MRKSTTLFASLLLALASCGSEEPTQATFTDAISAMDTAASAMNTKDFGTAVNGYQYAMDNTTDAGGKFKIAQELFKAHVKNNNNAAATALLATMKTDMTASLTDQNLSLLTDWCINEKVADMAQAVFEVAMETLGDNPGSYDLEKVGKAIAAVRSGDVGSLADLGYAGD
jgi:hypothetical protein